MMMVIVGITRVIMAFCMISSTMRMRKLVIFSILFFTNHVSLIPGCFHEDFKGRIQMHDKNKKYQADDSEYGEENDLHRDDRKECNDG
jgi:hypothetical protein